jgi:hypothetical protein
VRDSLETILKPNEENSRTIVYDKATMSNRNLSTSSFGAITGAKVVEQKRLGTPTSVRTYVSAEALKVGLGITSDSPDRIQDKRGHNRSSSGLSVNTRSIIGAFNNLVDTDAPMSASKSSRDEDEAFDALIRSNETVKISLTPSRLKSFEVGSTPQ